MRSHGFSGERRLVVLVSMLVLSCAFSASARAGSLPRPVSLNGVAPCDAPFLGAGTGEGTNDPTLFPASVGQLHAAMLFVEFPDARGTTSPGAIFDSYMPAVERWYSSVSYNRLHLVVTPLERWIELSHPASYYRDGRVDEAAREAVAIADATFDFSSTQAVYIVPALSAFLGPLGVGILDQPLQADAGSIRAIAWLTTDNGTPAVAVPYAVHETAHVLGLPDLYRSGSRASFNWWDTTATGGTAPVTGGLFAWHRWKLGWLDPQQLACLSRRGTLSIALSPVETVGGIKALVVRVGAAAYVAEIRQPIGEDATICQPGVLVYDVDLTRPPKRDSLRVLSPRFDAPARRVRCGSQWNATLTVGQRLQLGRVTFTVLSAAGDGSFRIRARLA